MRGEQSGIRPQTGGAIMTHVRKISAILLATVSQLAYQPPASAAGGDPVIQWNAVEGKASTKACMNALDNGDPFHESRMLAIMHIAIHDALNAIDRKYQPYAYDKKAPPGASPDAAVAAASHDVLVPLITNLPDLVKQSCIEAGVASIEAAYTEALAAIPDSPA